MMQLPELKPALYTDGPDLSEFYLKALAMGATLQEVFLDPEKRCPAILVKTKEDFR